MPFPPAGSSGSFALLAKVQEEGVDVGGIEATASADLVGGQLTRADPAANGPLGDLEAFRQRCGRVPVGSGGLCRAIQGSAARRGSILPA